MFCTSLRGRPPFASILPQLRSPPLALREARLNTHDLEVNFNPHAEHQARNTSGSRCLRVLLLAAAEINDAKVNESMQRIRHFAALTGGQDLIIVFLLSSPPSTNSALAGQVTADSDVNDLDSENGMIAYSKLQAEMINHDEIPNIPILPLQNIDRLSPLLTKYLEKLNRPPPTAKPSMTAFDLLQHCTMDPPMSQQTSYILTDLFPDLKALAAVCLSVGSAPNSSSPSARAAGMSSQLPHGYDMDIDMGTQSSSLDVHGKLKRLRDLVGDSVCRDIVDFWKDEWALD